MESPNIKSLTKSLGPGIILLFSAVPVAYLIYLVNNAFPNQPERAASLIGCFFLIILILPPALYILYRRKSADPWKLALIVIATISVLMVCNYLYWVSYYILFPADILQWSESDFVNDILKFRIGYPLYTAQQNNESFLYTPGSQILTYLLAKLSGHPTSIAIYRMIQLGYVILAAMLGALCCRKLIEMSNAFQHLRHRSLWSFVWLPIFFLVGTNTITNHYITNLHNDALSLLISALAYWLLLDYTLYGKKRTIALMALIPAVGFFVKQSLLIWLPLFLIHLSFFYKPRSFKRLLSFSLSATLAFGVVFGGCYLFWREHFIYWAFASGKNPVSIVRSFQHIMDAWIYFAIGIFSGIVLLRKNNLRLLFGPWLIWFIFILIEAYTSGIAWMINHMGPGSLIAGSWFIAALAGIWPSGGPAVKIELQRQNWLRAGMAVMFMGLVFNGLGFIRIPIKPISDDAYRYVNEIEKEFQGMPASKILLDAGTWIYLKEGVVMKDRASPMGDRGYSGIGDFSGIISRLKEKHYSKILIRKLNAPDFFYDNRMWKKSSNIRQTFLENYHEIGKIEAVQGTKLNEHPYYFFDEIKILAPNED